MTPEPVVLTAREREVLMLIVSGAGFKATAKVLRISKRTVDAHVQSIKKKAGVSGPPTRLVRWYYEVFASDIAA